MTYYSPAPIRKLFDDIKALVPQAVLSGIMGDAAHFASGGYHVPRNALNGWDYSNVLAADALGDGDAASALDISLPAAQMELVSARLMAACKANDPRLAALREWFGTLNGTKVTGWDRHDPSTPNDDTLTYSDDSHLWHVHLSFYRKYANDYAAIKAIAEVIGGTEGDDPLAGKLTDEQLAQIWGYVIPGELPNGSKVEWPAATWLRNTNVKVRESGRTLEDVKAAVVSIQTVVGAAKTGVLARVAQVQSVLAEIKSNPAATAEPASRTVTVDAKAVADRLLEGVKGLTFGVRE